MLFCCLLLLFWVYVNGMSFPGGSDGKESAGNEEDLGSIPGLGRSPRGGHGNPFQYSCLDNPHGQRSLVGYSPWGHKESDTAEQVSTATQHYAVFIPYSAWIFFPFNKKSSFQDKTTTYNKQFLYCESNTKREDIIFKIYLPWSFLLSSSFSCSRRLILLS